MIIIAIKKLWGKIKAKAQIESLLRIVFKKTPFLTGLLILGSYQIDTVLAQSTTLVYDVIRKHKVIGYIKTTEFIEDNEIHYKIDSHVSASILFLKYRIKFSQSGTYKDNRLVTGSLTKEVNGKIKESNRIKLNGNGYEITQRDKPAINLERSINYSISALYNSEPIDRSVVFSENHLQFIPIKKVSPQEYQITLPNGKTNTYKYENNICIYAEINAGISKVILQLQDKYDGYAATN